MQRIAKPQAVLLSVSMVTLALAGVLYSHWSDTLEVEALADTGEVAMEWDFIGACAEFWTWPDLPQGTGFWPDGPFGEVEDKDVGDFEVAIRQSDRQIVDVLVLNGYPSYAFDCELHYENVGSVPVIVRGARVVSSSGLTNCLSIGGPQTPGIACDQLTVRWFDGIGSQIEPLDGSSGSLIVHVEQLAEQGRTVLGQDAYRFSLEVCFSNWNEPQTGDECFAVDDQFEG